ncbi:MAG: hypothetical protein WBB07_15685 [Mycobacterium sp.]
MMSISKNFTRSAVAAVFGGSLLVTAGIGIATAEPTPPPPTPGPDGLVTVVVGGVNYLDSVPIEQASQAVAEMCALPAPAVSAMATQVDANGVSQTACAGQTSGEVIVAQNAVAALEPSPVVPGTNATVDGESTAPAPTGSEESNQGDLTGAGSAEPPQVPEGETRPEPNNPTMN